MADQIALRKLSQIFPLEIFVQRCFRILPSVHFVMGLTSVHIHILFAKLSFATFKLHLHLFKVSKKKINLFHLFQRKFYSPRNYYFQRNYYHSVVSLSDSSPRLHFQRRCHRSNMTGSQNITPDSTNIILGRTNTMILRN